MMEQGYTIGAEPSRSGAGSGTAFGPPDTLTLPLQCLLLFVAVLASYFHTLGVPYYFDDFTSIRENPAIREFSSAAAFAEARAVGYLSFALNYALHGYTLAGYHLVNILIHFGAGLAVFGLTHNLLRSPALIDHRQSNLLPWLPLFAALLFVLHPLQTQAVTYITQRLASMAALFYLLTLLFYLQARLTALPRERVLFTILAGGMALLALFTKQNAVTLPLAVLLIEWIFLRPPHRVLALLVGLGGAMMLAAGLFLQLGRGLDVLALVDAGTQETDSIGRTQYLALQMEVLWDYLRKFVLPLGLHLDYDLPVPESFWSGRTVLFALGHLLLIGAAVLLHRRSPLPAFGILFYYCAHLVESSLIPIRDFGFEHRTYLPNFGLCLLAGWLLLGFLPRRVPVPALASGCALLLVVLGGLTWARNAVWRDPIAFFQHEIAINPENFRAHSMLGEYYLRAGQPDLALEAYREAAGLYGRVLYKETNAEVAFYSNYVLALDNAGDYDGALRVVDELDLPALPAAAQAIFLSRRGIVHAKQNRFAEAERDFVAAVEQDPNNLDAVLSLAKVYFLTNRQAEALPLFERALELDPVNADAQSALQLYQQAP